MCKCLRQYGPSVLLKIFCSLVGDPAGVQSKFFSMGTFTCHPTGRGWIHIRDGQDPSVQPEFVSGCLSTPDELALCKFAYKRTREIARRMACFRGEHAAGHPQFSEKSDAACKAASGPVPINAPDIRYSEEDDKVLVEYLKVAVNTTWHSVSLLSVCRLLGLICGVVARHVCHEAS